MTQFSVIGKRMPRVDGFDKVTGKAVYGTDIKLPRMLVGKILRSPLPHARILHIDTSLAKRLPGVKAVLTGLDTPQIKFGFFKHQDHKFGDCHPLKCDKVRCIGDEVAAVAAVDEDIAQEALGLIKVDYEELPPVFDPEDALKPGAPLVHEEAGSNLLTTINIVSGDVDAAFARASVVVEDSFRTQPVHPCCLEPKQAVADFSPAGTLTFYSSTQMPFFMRRDLADTVGLEESKVRVIKTTMGGHFGSRMEMHPLDPICALLSQAAGRPVRIVYTREEDFTASRFRHPMTLRLKMGASRDGKLLATDMKVTLDSGAYCSQALGVANVIGTNALLIYPLPNLRYVSDIVYTNNPYGGSFRGYGNPQGTFAVEAVIDTLAEELGLYPLELRRRNAWKSGDVSILRQVMTSCGFDQCLDEVTKRCRWDGKSSRAGQGSGLAGFLHVGGGARVHGNNDGCGAWVKVEDNGGVTLITGAQEIGQGGNTILSQIVAEELGVPLASIKVQNTDTDTMPWDLGCHASRTTFVGGNAALAAAKEAKAQLLEAAAAKLEASVGDLLIQEGKIFVAGSPERCLTIAEAAHAHHYRQGGSSVIGKAFYDPPSEEPRKGIGNRSAAYAFGFQAAELSVDGETGQVDIQKMVAAHDLGRAINPMLAEGQLEGAVVQGMGYALMEELTFDSGKIANASFADYALPSALDIPSQEIVLVESIDPQGPFGAKGLGESGLVPTAPAIANAVYAATGVRIKELPLTPEKVFNAIKRKG
ncbi:MAG: xanthine dehydrogenase family protein molybdopterin-binding subunit [Thermodesulfobacteriota bacterium]